MGIQNVIDLLIAVRIVFNNGFLNILVSYNLYYVK